MFLLERKFKENDEQLDLAIMCLLWPQSSDEIVILRPRESSGTTLGGGFDSGRHRVPHRRATTPRAFFIDPLRARERRVQHQLALKTKNGPPTI